MILIVVDDPDFIKTFQETLGTPDGYVSLYADSGMRALDLLSTLGEIDLVLIDLNLKREDAFTVASVLKAEHPEVPIMVLGDQPPMIKLVGADETLRPPISRTYKHRI